MNISLKKQKKIRERLIEKLPEIIKARKLKKEIMEFLIETAFANLTEDERYIYENFPGLIDVYEGTSNLRITGEGFCENTINCRYYCWNNEYDSNEVFREAYFNPSYTKNTFDNLIESCPKLFRDNCSDILPLLNPTDQEKLKNKVNKFINYLIIAEKKLSKVSTIISSREINLSDIKKYSPKLYREIKLELLK